MSILAQAPPNARVVVVRLRSLGDCVLTTPALSILHDWRPDLKVSVVVEDRFAAVFHGNPAVCRTLGPSLTAMAALRPFLCLNLHGGTRSMWLTAASLASYRAGFAHHKGSAIYNCRVPRAQQILGEERTVHTAEHLASAIFHLGAPRVEIPRAVLFATDAPVQRPYAVIHPVAATPSKTWPAPNFLRLAEHLRRDHDLEPIFIGSATEDLSAFAAAFRVETNASLESTKSLLKGASLFVGNDSGPAHMAAAFSVPVVVLFGPSNPLVWAPWRTTSEVLVDATDIATIPVEAAIRAADRVRVRA